jgi:hypothetical protein
MEIRVTGMRNFLHFLLVSIPLAGAAPVHAQVLLGPKEPETPGQNP